MSALMQAAQPLFEPAFAAWGAQVTWAECLAFALALAMVLLNIRVNPWGWPLAIASSLLYFGLFWNSRLYGDAGLQVFFALIALWGWWQWLRGRAADGAALRVRWLAPRARWALVAAFALAWPAMGFALLGFTDTDVPWWDAFPTAGSVIGQWLLGRKFVETWAVWLLVNAVAVALFAYKGLWLTVLLYLVFIVLSLQGWRAWSRLAKAAA